MPKSSFKSLFKSSLMSKQTIALAYARPADALEESEYLALVEALSESARGRGFLAEHARRSRSAETNILLTAIERIEAQVRPRMPAPGPFLALVGLATLKLR